MDVKQEILGNLELRNEIVFERKKVIWFNERGKLRSFCLE